MATITKALERLDQDTPALRKLFLRVIIGSFVWEDPSKIRLKFETSNEKAIRIYRKAGFIEIE